MKRNSKAVLPPLPQRAVKMLARLKHVRGISDDEKSIHALGLAATPEERWELTRNHLRSFNHHILLIRQMLKSEKSATKAGRKRTGQIREVTSK